MSKILTIGDPHFKTSNISDVEEFILKIEKLIQTENPDIIVMLGDLLHEHERLHITPLNKAYEFIQLLAKYAPTYCLVGNHDMINNQQFLNNNHWLSAMKEWDNVFIADKVLKHNLDNGKYLIFCPYVPNGRFIEALDTIDEKDWKCAELIFAHQEFLGCRMGAIESLDGDKWDIQYPPVISGHIHSNQKLENVYYPGSAMQNAFGDPNNIIAIVDIKINQESDQIKYGNYYIREIDLELRKKKLVYIDISDVNTYQVPNTRDDIKLTINGNFEEFKIFKNSKKYKELIDAGIKIVQKNKKYSALPTEEVDSLTISNDLEIQKEDIEQLFIKDTIRSLVYNTNDPLILSDFNYIFLGEEKNTEILIL